MQMVTCSLSYLKRNFSEREIRALPRMMASWIKTSKPVSFLKYSIRPKEYKIGRKYVSALETRK